ncbi:hypothetical protein V5E97_01155 [Singulisphaera sp. Ch08]|uniref:Uncharacterized protein n=1 Tax=Singulisphaera sp. Ch08 TaxID=3120278 RepID=A0AAU7CHN0_9BACT
MPQANCLALLLAIVLTGPSSAFAGSFFHRPEGTPPPGPPRSIEHTHHRAGHPTRIADHANATNGPSYVGYYVGGGSAHGGCSRRVEEGTWGWDYEGIHFPRRVWLSWSHGRRSQGGTGAYKTDGPHIGH